MLALLTLIRRLPHAECREKFPGRHFYLLAIIIPTTSPRRDREIANIFQALAHACFPRPCCLDRRFGGLPISYPALII
jgi:hypothetical protein